jgi:hypothetical protein
MAGLFEGIAPPNVETTRSTAQQAPGYLTEYLSNLAQAGTSALGTTTPAVKDAAGNITTPASFVPKTGEQLIAPMSDLQKMAYANAPGALLRYQSPLDEALKAGKSAMDVSATDISKFYDPYETDVINQIEKQGQQSLMRNVMPALKALGVSGGAGTMGGSRIGTVSGQALADFASQLEGQKIAAQQNMYKTALDAALREQAQQTGAAGALGQLGGTEMQAASTGLKTAAELGGQQTAYDQSKLEAPLTRAANVAQILRGYNYPTTTTETYKGPANVYGPSPLSQIAGLGTLLGAAFPSGGQGVGDRILRAITGGKAADAANFDWDAWFKSAGVQDPGLSDMEEDIYGAADDYDMTYQYPPNP